MHLSFNGKTALHTISLIEIYGISVRIEQQLVLSKLLCGFYKLETEKRYTL